jgi:hypothetical protein
LYFASPLTPPPSFGSSLYLYHSSSTLIQHPFPSYSPTSSSLSPLSSAYPSSACNAFLLHQLRC